MANGWRWIQAIIRFFVAVRKIAAAAAECVGIANDIRCCIRSVAVVQRRCGRIFECWTAGHFGIVGHIQWRQSICAEVCIYFFFFFVEQRTKNEMENNGIDKILHHKFGMEWRFGWENANMVSSSLTQTHRMNRILPFRIQPHRNPARCYFIRNSIKFRVRRNSSQKRNVAAEGYYYYLKRTHATWAIHSRDKFSLMKYKR